jgi:hypothetical protein
VPGHWGVSHRLDRPEHTVCAGAHRISPCHLAHQHFSPSLPLGPRDADGWPVGLLGWAPAATAAVDSTQTSNYCGSGQALESHLFLGRASLCRLGTGANTSPSFFLGDGLAISRPPPLPAPVF